MIMLAGTVTSVIAQLPPEPNDVAVQPRSLDAVLVPVNDQPQAGNAGLFVGINSFTEDRGLSPLQFAVHDAIEQAYLFVVELRLIPPKNCVLALSGTPSAAIVRSHQDTLAGLGVTVSDAKKTTILKSLATVVGETQHDEEMLIVSFCSHGFEQNRTAYVLPSDGLRSFLDETALRLTTIEASVERAKAGHRLLLVDACQERISGDTRGSEMPQGPGMSAAFVAALREHTGQGKFASCSSGQYSHENYRLGDVGHGLFSFAILEALRGGALPDQENLVRLDDVIAYVSYALSAAAWSVARTPSQGSGPH